MRAANETAYASSIAASEPDFIAAFSHMSELNRVLLLKVMARGSTPSRRSKSRRTDSSARVLPPPMPRAMATTGLLRVAAGSAATSRTRSVVAWASRPISGLAIVIHGESMMQPVSLTVSRYSRSCSPGLT